MKKRGEDNMGRSREKRGKEEGKGTKETWKEGKKKEGICRRQRRKRRKRRKRRRVEQRK